MNIIPIHYKKSKRVEKFVDIMREAYALKELSDSNFAGRNSKCVALHHSQVSADPFNFFTVSKHVADGLFPDPIIINPQIISVDESTAYRIDEGCMSFPFRSPKKMKRYFKIRVKYNTPVGGLLRVWEEDCEGLKAHIFQHECDHAQGRNIFFTE